MLRRPTWHVSFADFTRERLIPKDYTITATSRVTNIWAYVVNFVTCIIVAIIARKRKKKAAR